MKTILLLSSLLVLVGCKYDAPLTDKPTREVDSALLGSWFSLADGKPLDVFRLSAVEYLVVDDKTPYVCTHSDFAGISFISCLQIKNDKDAYGKFAYIAYRIENGELVTMNLSEALVIKENATPREVRLLIGIAAKDSKALDTSPEHVGRYKKKTG